MAPLTSEPVKNVWFCPAVMSSGENPFGSGMVSGRESAEAEEKGRNARTATMAVTSTPSDLAVATRGWDMETPRCLPPAPSLGCGNDVRDDRRIPGATEPQAGRFTSGLLSQGPDRSSQVLGSSA